MLPGGYLLGAYFRELRYGEVRRIPLPRTPVNEGKGKGRSPHHPGPSPLAPLAYLASTFQRRLAGVGSVLPAASVAFTSKVWVPLARLVYVLLVAVPLASQIPPSLLVWKVAFGGSVEEKVNVASLLLTVPEGPETMVVFGGVVSALPGAPWHASVPAGLVLLGGFSAPKFGSAGVGVESITVPVGLLGSGAINAQL